VKLNGDCEFRRHVVEGFDDVGGAFFDHACGEERRIDHIVGLRRRILAVKVGHDSHLRADDGRISLPIYPDKQTISAPRTSQKYRYCWKGRKSNNSEKSCEVYFLDVAHRCKAL